MKVLAGFIASLLASFIFAASFSMVLNKTITNPDYIKQKAKETGLFEDVSTLVAHQFAANSGAGVGAVQIEATVKSILTPGYIEKKTNDFLDQYKARYEGNGAVPTLNLSDLVSDAKKLGINLPDDQFAKPFSIPSNVDKQIKESVTVSHKVENYTYIATGVLFLILFLLCVKAHSYWPLVSLFVTSALLQLGLYITMLNGPELIFVRLGKQGESTDAIIVLAEKFSKSIALDMASQFLTFAAIFGGIALISFGFAMVSVVRYSKLPASRKLES